MDGRLKLLIVLSPVALWQALTPDVILNYSSDASSELNYIWNTHHRIYKRSLRPGETTGDYGPLFQRDDFFMEFDWWDNKGISGCISIYPQWPRTHIYLDAKGLVDTSPQSGTDVERLKPCGSN
ncbi:hypothetical protein RYA05_20860 [Pseudomonas syringae pv. actinidiae]|uniref:CAS/CSE protein involved in chromosome segregation n=3 Tax=Pseudomonas syringae group TaxID=136849 RepID=A0A0K8LUW6_PSESF|nr:hypothetical protein [Pseudomonas syringae]EPN14873.1 hypothetical protein A259_16323 [Pseudomonas syringae pv. actinidiae ICMP 19070]EPN61859.1 hypothetical protein A235_21306 [Pseudomonas syringae pv. actinidiae ICMP 19079]EPN75794.1 hypothetical protein A234_15964 [Pseudomonas syringae pv. actinidiae ICMP 19101]OZI84607.1 hypothetical protein CFN58_23590 [Pseudomonas avellanae]AKT30045.1 hypothetical protein IYO_010990 [Pseudomonas syringae pv. actinidiae ICMP 18884]